MPCAAILEAEGNKQASILESEGIQQSEINTAEGLKQALILKATGEAEARIKVAEAEADAVSKVTKSIKEAGGNPTAYLIALKYIDIANREHFLFQIINYGKDAEHLKFVFKHSFWNGFPLTLFHILLMIICEI